MRLWWGKGRSDQHAESAVARSEGAVSTTAKPKQKRKPIAGVAGFMAISTEDGLQHPLAPRTMKPHDELSEDRD